MMVLFALSGHIMVLMPRFVPATCLVLLGGAVFYRAWDGLREASDRSTCALDLVPDSVLQDTCRS